MISFLKCILHMHGLKGKGILLAYCQGNRFFSLMCLCTVVSYVQNITLTTSNRIFCNNGDISYRHCPMWALEMWLVQLRNWTFNFISFKCSRWARVCHTGPHSSWHIAPSPHISLYTSLYSLWKLSKLHCTSNSKIPFKNQLPA